MSLRVAAALMPLILAPPLFAQPGSAGKQAPAATRPQPSPLEAEFQLARRNRVPTMVAPAPPRGRPMLVGGNWAASDRVVMGVGMFRVPKVDRNDPNRNQPMRDPSGKTMGVAALGLNLRF